MLLAAVVDALVVDSAPRGKFLQPRRCRLHHGHAAREQRKYYVFVFW
jgi:hypothetical protein